MRNLIIALALVACAGPAVALTSIEDRAWSETCDLLQTEYGYSCAGIPRPEVKYLDMDDVYGYYSGGDTVYVSDVLRGFDRFATLIHEMVHYYDQKSARSSIPGDSYETCPSEERAWHIEGRWWIKKGRRDMNHSRDWWLMYPHCQAIYYQPAVVMP